MVEVVETLEVKLKRHEDALSLCMAEIQKLRAENALLRSAEGAHDVLRRIYLNEAESSATRVKAAQASINFEKSRLENVPPPMELTAEPVEPLHQLIERQRARADRMAREARQIRVLPNGQVLVLDEPNGDGGDDSSNNGNDSAGNGPDNDTAG